MVEVGSAVASGSGVSSWKLWVLAVVQWDIPQQIWHHHCLVHVVDGANKAVHGVEERVLLVVGVRYLHHGGQGISCPVQNQT